MRTLTKIILFPMIGIVLCNMAIADTGKLSSIKDIKSHPSNLVTWVADQDYLSSTLVQAPNVSERIPSDVLLEVPTFNGGKHAFRFFETSVMHQSLAKRYPDIKSYMGIGLENPSHRASIVIHEGGLFGLVINDEGRSHIRMLDGELIIQSGDVVPTGEDQCEINQHVSDSRDLNDDVFWDCVGTDSPCYPVGSTLTTYRFAGIMSERANNEQTDGTVEGGLAWMVSMVNQINLLWVRELGFKLEMVEGSDQLIFTNENPAPEPFQKDPSCHSSGDPKYCELEEVKPYLESVIGPGGDDTPQSERTWEYGAHFDTRYNGGVAYAPGSTSTNNASYEVFNHEIGHNLGSSHNITIENGWRCSIGGTIMGSRVRTLEGTSGDQYSSHTIELAMNYRNDQTIYQDIGIWAGNYVTGSQSEETGNIIPDLVVPESGFIIPKETPFVLEGMSTPYESDHTFSWEQNDASDQSFSMNPLDEQLPFFHPTKGPLFSTVEPTPEGYRRSFPAMESILDNNYDTETNDYGTMLTVEKLPFASREMNMRLLVRTNDPYAGSFNYENVQFFVAGTAGPFRITSQADSTTWAVGSEQVITWDVANTDDPDSVNCQTVAIYLSIDGSMNFNYLLADDVPNNGSHSLTIPPLPPSNSARLMIRSVGNVFFDVNNGSISILNDNTPHMSLSQDDFEISMQQDSTETYYLQVTNDGEDGSVLNFRSYVGMEFLVDETFEQEELPAGWYDTTNAVNCENPGWFISEDASSSYFEIPPGDGLYIATNDDACNSDGSNDILYTGEIQLADGMIELSFDRFFRTGFGHTLHILITTDSWVTSTEIFSLGYLDGSEEWVREIIELDEYSGQVIELGFHSNDNGQWASGVALDNLSIGVTPSWISSNSMGYAEYLESETIDFTIDTDGMDLGIYHRSIVVENVQTLEKDTVDLHLTLGESTVMVDEEMLPNDFHLFQNHPNPFNPKTNIGFNLPSDQDVTLIIYDMIGRVVLELGYEGLRKGHHQFKWDGKNQHGNSVSAGIYLYNLSTPTFTMTRKMILLK